MKKILAIAIFTLAMLAAPNISKAQSVTLWPTGPGTAVTFTATGTTNLTIKDNLTYNSTIPTLTGNLTINVAVDSKLRKGAHLMIVIKTTATETTTFTGKIIGPVVTGVAGKTWSQLFIYNGTNFYPAGAKIQVD